MGVLRGDGLEALLRGRVAWAAVGEHPLEPGGAPLLLDEDERAPAPLAQRAHHELQLEPLVGLG